MFFKRGVVQSTKLVPPELQGVVDRETFDKARAYAIDKSNFSLVESIYSQMLSTVSPSSYEIVQNGFDLISYVTSKWTSTSCQSILYIFCSWSLFEYAIWDF